MIAMVLMTLSAFL
uniref:Uncharacterized protein n=1 Tax=Anguilla anguilla TaxID=7936 RepID=A0A0E9W2M5_ANGAN